MSAYTPKLALTMGDAAGIGPEVIAQGILARKIPKDFQIIIIGDVEVLRDCLEHYGLVGEYSVVHDVFEAKGPGVFVYHFASLDRNNFLLGKPHAGAGDLAYKCILEGVRLCKEGLADALVTGPICKESLHLAGHKFDGHTGLIAQTLNCERYRMTFCTKDLKIIHTTAHLALREACDKITKNRVLETIQIGWEHLMDWGMKDPKVAVCGLNPHASEAGIFGSEDLAEVIPAIEAANAMGMNVHGPFSADTIFLKAFAGEYQLVVAQYHDQGHIPGKLMAFDQGVNVTLGLPIIRTSVDHGTAFDIVGRGLANPGNLWEAMNYALGLVKIRSSRG